MKRYIVLVICAILPSLAMAQNNRVVNGVVFNEQDAPIKGVKITSLGLEEPFVTGENGTFLVNVSPYAKQIMATCDGYLPAKAEIDGSYIIFRLKVDKEYEARKVEEAAAKARAEEEARKAEEQARLAAERKAAAEAAAKARAEEEARKAEEQARLAAERKAAAEAAAKARAEEEARKAEEQARLAAERKAAAEAAAKARAEEQARIAAEKAAKKDARIALDTKYNSEFRNKGLINTLEVSYSYHLYEGNVVYENLGYRDFTTLHPISAVYMLGYRFCNWVSLSVGAGITYDIINLRNYGDKFYSEYKDADKYANWDVPIFLNLKTYLSRGKAQPLFSVSGGAYARSAQFYIDFGVGCNLRLSKRCNMYFMATFGTAPMGQFIEDAYKYVYESNRVWAPGFKVGFSL